MAKKITPEIVSELSMCEIFVFGSNPEGYHESKDAKIAHQKFGAEWGIGHGPTGKCYAIPILQGGVDKIKPYVDEFIEYVKNHPNNRFLVTRIGCDSGYSDKQMAQLFKEARKYPNVTFTLKWFPYVFSDDFIDACCGCPPSKEPVKTPRVITDKTLMDLCEKYKYLIGTRLIKYPLPEITIRYAIANDKFGYAKFGDFFFDESGNLFVWTKDKKFESKHNQEAVERYFGDECHGRGFCHQAIFAGVETPYKDSKGSQIYTGDVLRVILGVMDESGKWKKRVISDEDFELFSDIWAFGTLGENEEDWEALYAFPLDNHFASPDMIARWERIGTVFYQLDFKEQPKTVSSRCWDFQSCYSMGYSNEDKCLLSKFTPNFDKEIWKYRALESLGAEFKWNKNNFTNI